MLHEDKDLDWLFKNYQTFFDKFGMNKENIADVYYEWKEDEADTILKYLWAIFEKLLYETYEQVLQPEAKFKILSLILEEMWNYKRNYLGEKANDIYKKYLYCQLKLIQFSAMTVMVSVVAVRCCPYCDALNGKQLSVEEALQNQFLPAVRCINEVGCSCYYKPNWLD
jgi:6-phosphogluconate dehydrogenase